MTTHFSAPRLVPDDDRDPELTGTLRALYTAPSEDSYWSALEQRIMARIARGESLDAWWYVPAQYVRLGLIAAGFALIVTGALLLRSRADQRQMAFETIVGPAQGGPTLAVRDAVSERQATLDYINGR